MQNQILKLVEDKFKKTHGGISLIELGELTNITQEELKPHLNALYQAKKIIVRNGINLKLIYPNEQI